MENHWYLITGYRDEFMIVKTTYEKVDKLAEVYVENGEYAIYSIADIEHGLNLIKLRSRKPPYLVINSD